MANIDKLLRSKVLCFLSKNHSKIIIKRIINLTIKLINITLVITVTSFLRGPSSVKKFQRILRFKTISTLLIYSKTRSLFHKKIYQCLAWLKSSKNCKGLLKLLKAIKFLLYWILVKAREFNFNNNHLSYLMSLLNIAALYHP